MRARCACPCRRSSWTKTTGPAAQKTRPAWPSFSKGRSSGAIGRRSLQTSEEGICHSPLVKQVRLFASDALPQRLELEPPGAVRTHLPAREQRVFAVDRDRLACRFGQKLRLATAVHGDEPPHRFIDAFANGQQAVIAQNRRLARP